MTTILPTRRGFTLIELIVVISIVAILVGISFPVLRAMERGSQVQMAANSVEAAVSGARAYATRTINFTAHLDDLGGPYRTAQDDGDGYSGAAVVVTPSNELRVVENDQGAKATDGRSLELYRSGGNIYIYNGYRAIDVDGDDIADVDDLRMPSDVVLLGIWKNPSGVLELLPAPFAISFNARGTVVTRTGVDAGRRDGFVYYDGDGDGDYDLGADRASSSVDLTAFRRGSAPLMGDDSGRSQVPWEKLEPVIGVVIIDPRDFPDFVPGNPNPIAGPDAENVLARASETGRVLFFNRYTGQNIAQ